MYEKIQFFGADPINFKKDIAEEVKNVLIPILKKHVTDKGKSEYLTRNEVSEMFKVDLSTVYNWTYKSKILTAFQIGGRIYYKRSQIDSVIVKLEK